MSKTGAANQVINPAKSPPLFVPIGMILAGLTGLLCFYPLLIWKAPMLFADFRFNSAALAGVHLFTLGFATAVMVGAFHQIVPVMLIGQPVNGRWAAGQGIGYLAGSTLLIAGFYFYDTRWIILGGTLCVLSLMLFVALVGRSMLSATQWNISGTYMIAALSFLTCTVLWGLTLALNLRYNFLGDTLSHAPLAAHLVLGLGGWFMLTIFGVTFQLIPMFALSSRGDESVGRTALILLTVGLSAAFLALAFRLPAAVTAVTLVTVLAGVLFYTRDMAGILRRRRRPEFDLGMRFALTSFGFLALSLALALPLPQVAVWLFLPGFVGSMILGMLYKIVPFLFWHYLLKHRSDKSQRLPPLIAMYNPLLAEVGYWLCTGGTLLTAAVLAMGAPAAWSRWPLALSAIGTLCFVTTILQVLRAKPLP